jgi:hypothetical protein
MSAIHGAFCTRPSVARKNGSELTEAAIVSWRSRSAGILLFEQSEFKIPPASLKRAEFLPSVANSAFGHPWPSQAAGTEREVFKREKYFV